MQGINLKNYAAHSLDPTPNNLFDDETVMHNNYTRDVKMLAVMTSEDYPTIAWQNPPANRSRNIFVKQQPRWHRHLLVTKKTDQTPNQTIVYILVETSARVAT